MTLLPVARRELMVAARRPSSRRVRIGSAVFAALSALVMLLFISASGAGRQGGVGLFVFMTWGIHVFALLAGAFLTADALSEERRDGTLGFLFLTEIGGFEVVLSKFLGAALDAACGMAATFPVIATAWFLGGVTEGEFWRALLAALATLFVSLALGLLVSSVARDQTRAVGTTIALLLGAAILPTGLGVALKALQASGKVPPVVSPEFVASLSPLAPFLAGNDAAYHASPGHFWTALGTTLAAALAMLAAAAWITARGWRDGGAATGVVAWIGRLAGARVGARRRRLSPREVDRNPLAALLRGGGSPTPAAWGIVAIGAVTAATAVASRGNMAAAMAMGLPLGLLRALVAWESTVFLGEPRRTGELEIALAAPIDDATVYESSYRHLWKRLAVPAGVLVALDAITSAITAPSGPFVLIPATLGLVGFGLQFIAMARLGAWFSLTEQRPLVAFAKTLAIGGLLPAVANYACCLGILFSAVTIGWVNHRLVLPVREVLNGARHPWQVQVDRMLGWDGR